MSVPFPENFANEHASRLAELRFFNLASKVIYEIRELKKSFVLEVKGDIVLLTATMPEPLNAAWTNALVLEKIISQHSNYKVKKQRINREIVEVRLSENEKKFSDAQMKLADYRDAIEDIVSVRLSTSKGSSSSSLIFPTI